MFLRFQTFAQSPGAALESISRRFAVAENQGDKETTETTEQQRQREQLLTPVDEVSTDMLMRYDDDLLEGKSPEVRARILQRLQEEQEEQARRQRLLDTATKEEPGWAQRQAVRDDVEAAGREDAQSKKSGQAAAAGANGGGKNKDQNAAAGSSTGSSNDKKNKDPGTTAKVYRTTKNKRRLSEDEQNIVNYVLIGCAVIFVAYFALSSWPERSTIARRQPVPPPLVPVDTSALQAATEEEGEGAEGEGEPNGGVDLAYFKELRKALRPQKIYNVHVGGDGNYGAETFKDLARLARRKDEE